MRKDYDDLIRNDPLTEKHLTECTPAVTAEWFGKCPSELIRPMGAGFTAAALRGRLNVPHSDIAGSFIRCPGCNIELDELTICAHLSGCARIRGDNASSCHAALKQQVKDIIARAGCRADAQEPRGYEILPCPGRGCTAVLKTGGCRTHEERDGILQTHADICTAKTTLDDLLRAHRSGPDIRLRRRDGSNVVIDVTTTSSVTNSHASLDAAFSARENQKKRLYQEQAEANDELLLTVAFTPVGTPNEGARALAQILADDSIEFRGQGTEILSALSSAAVRCRAQSLFHAERLLGVKHTNLNSTRKVRTLAADPVPVQDTHDIAVGNFVLQQPRGPEAPAPVSASAAAAATAMAASAAYPQPVPTSAPPAADHSNPVAADEESAADRLASFFTAPQQRQPRRDRIETFILLLLVSLCQLVLEFVF